MSAAPRDAASVLFLRDGDRDPQVYMVRRHPASPFLPGALVFPGGRVEPGDSAPELAPVIQGADAERAARTLGVPLDQGPRALAHYVAAVRESFEECGLLATAPAAPSDRLEALRLELGSATSLASLLARTGLRLELGELRYLDHWLTPEVELRRYDTRFFVARAPGGQEARADSRETTSGDWLTAAEALAGHARGECSLAPPTLVLLERLAPHRSVSDALAAAPDRPVPCVMPRLAAGVSELTLLLPGDARYRDPAAKAGAEDVVVLRDGRWTHRASAWRQF
jgi:8-oxo-dGTP pyrophosphatase MutT (NUDIX family)